MQDLFAQHGQDLHRPLPDRMRPRTLDEFIGQDHLLGQGKPLREAIASGRPHSLIFWGPPGTGKTTLAHIISNHCDAEFMSISAVLSGVKEIRAAVDQAKTLRQHGRATVLFVDEVHRFNKSQQDAFLPHVEDGTVVFIGATTENPSFEVNNALLSRARTYVLKSLSQDDLLAILQQALNDAERGLGERQIQFENGVLERIVEAADGDGRRALSLLELAVDMAPESELGLLVNEEALASVLAASLRRFDKGGEAFYDQISAMHKSMRGSDPDACLYWLARMLDGGCDPLYIARRVVRMASEDVGNADPRALRLALDAWETQERLGSPEGELAIAQALVYLASAPKSNAVYKAFKMAMADVRESGSHDVPIHLRNAPTKLMKELGYGREYRYAHDEPEAYAAGEVYFPESLEPRQYYQPVPRGLELRIGERLDYLKQLDAKARGETES